MGDQAHISLDAWPDEQLKGSVSQIGDAPDAITGLYTVEVTVNSKNLNVKPGFFARAEITPSHKKTYTMVPINALQEGVGNQVYIYTVTPDKRLNKETIKVQEVFNDAMALSGHSALNGKHVVVEHAQELRANNLIVIANN